MSTQKTTVAAPNALAVSCRMLRSPSHESVTTDLSLFSTTSMASGMFEKHRLVTFKEQNRGSSPNPSIKKDINRISDNPGVIWFEEGSDLIKTCAVLSSLIGMQKSFSTSDITQLPSPDSENNTQLRNTMSELALNSLQRCGYMLDNPRLDHTSRSCSTWVAVGELASSSQLPSPHGGPFSSTQLKTSIQAPPAFTAADLIRSVNKKVRQNYIRRRLLNSYRAIERLSQSEFNLDRLEEAAAAAKMNISPGPTELIVPSVVKSASKSSIKNSRFDKQLNTDIIKSKISNTKNLTIHDIEKERGKPLSKYDRNMMIFNWLHTLDETAVDDDIP